MPVALAVCAVGLFAQAFIRLRRRGRPDHASWSRAAIFGAAVFVAVLALLSPLNEVAGNELLSAHMLQHVLIGDLVPVLLVVALRGPLLYFFFPARYCVCSEGSGRSEPCSASCSGLR